MAGPGNLEIIKETIEPIASYFDGIVAVFHNPPDAGATLLEQIKGAGKIIYVDFTKRYDFSRNHYLYCGPIQNGDFCVQTDLLEKIPLSFAGRLDYFITQLKSSNLNTCYYYGKPFVFEFTDDLEYRGNPHEGLFRPIFGHRGIELSHIEPDESKVRQNLRPIKRTDKFHFVTHYLFYYLFPSTSNCCLLGWEHKKPQEIQARNNLRIEFCQFLTDSGYPRTVDGVIDFFKQTSFSKFQRFVNEEKVLNDFYRFKILGLTDIIDGHDEKMIKKIEYCKEKDVF